MKSQIKNMRLNVLSLAVHAAVAAMFAMPMTVQAEEDEVAALTQPENTIEFGALYISESSAKFGEYTGLNDSGVEALGNLKIRGGDAYGGGDGTMRWGLSGTDLGLTSRSVNATLSSQGMWDLRVGYDGLQHNITDTYQTPQQGSLGGNVFTLPASFGTIDGSSAAGTRALTPAQLSAFHNVDIHTDRENTSFGAGYNFNRNWGVTFDYNHLDQSGARLISSGAQGGIALIGGANGRGESGNVLMNPTEYTTDTFNFSLNWRGDKGHISAGYHGVLFRDKYTSLSWQNAVADAPSACVGIACYTNNTMSTAPDSNFHQFNMTGGYVFSPATKLAGGFSYGVNTQDDNYAPTLLPQASGVAYNMMQAGGLPQSSLDGEVITWHADVKLTNRTTRDLTLSGGVKYNERDNNTASRTYLYNNIGGDPHTGVNTPYSNRKIQAELAVDYRVTRGQKLHLGYEHEYIKRWCDSVVGGAECVASPSSDEDKVRITYRVSAMETVHLHAGYAYSNRRADFDHNYFANVGSYPAAINGKDRLGFHAYIFDARTQHSVKAGLSWMATDRLDLSLDGRYSRADYDTALGVQFGEKESVNMDATYAYSEDASISAYASWQGSKRDLRSGNNGSVTVAPTNIWTNQLMQDSYAIGLNARRKGLLDRKLAVMGDISYSFDKSFYSTQVPYDPTCNTPSVNSCGDTPDINNGLFTLKLTGTYQVAKNGKVALGYTYQHLSRNDYFFNALQYGFTPEIIVPSNERKAGYSVNVVTLSYIYSF